MEAITYKDGPGAFNVLVYLDKRRVGTIVKLATGWQYQAGMGVAPYQGGEIFPTLNECKRSLEAK